MPELDGFELAAMIRQHPRCRRTAIIFVSAVHLSDLDRVKGYETGAVDYVSVPVVPEILRAKIGVFADLYRKTSELERLNHTLEERVSERTAELAVHDRPAARARAPAAPAGRGAGRGGPAQDRVPGDARARAAQSAAADPRVGRAPAPDQGDHRPAAVGARRRRPPGEPARAPGRRSARREPHQQRQARAAQGHRRLRAHRRRRRGVESAARRAQAPARRGEPAFASRSTSTATACG